MRVFIAIALMFASTGTVQAETRYIVDQAKLPMRAGQSTSHKIVRMLPSGAAVELLEQSTEGYARIRTSDGREGWILSRYLMKAPAARDRLEKIEQELSRLGALKKSKATAERSLRQLKAENSRLDKELNLLRKTASEASVMVEENRSLRVEADEAKRALREFQIETDDVTNQAHQRWFLLGGGAVLIGVLLGLLLPYVRPRRKKRWGGY